MGFFGKLFGSKKDAPMLRDAGQLVLRRAEHARGLRLPTEPNFSDEPQPPCESCGSPLEELFITTGGPLGDPDVWRDHPVAVDGWACVACSVFRYPRKVSPEHITEISDEGVEHGQAGRVAEAELCFARMVWDWPGYMPGHLNYAEATAQRLQRETPSDRPLVRALEQRMLYHFERAIEIFLDELTPAVAAPAIARCCVTVAEFAASERDLDRARTFLAKLDQLVGVPPQIAERAAELVHYMDTRLDLVDALSDLVGTRIRLADRPMMPPETLGIRQQIEHALARFEEEHLAVAPERWQSHWLLAKTLTLLGRDEDASVAWERAVTRFPTQRELTQDYSIELILAKRFPEARALVQRFITAVPDDAQAHCNLAVLDILSGDLDAAERSLDRCVELDPKDRVAPVVRLRLIGYRNGAPLPRTIAELERGAR